MLKSHHWIRLAWGMLGFIVVSLTGCLSSEGDESMSRPAYVSIYHASPDTPPLDVVLRAQKINREPFRYADFMGYSPFYTGNRLFQFIRVSNGAIVLDTVLNVVPDRFYSVFLVNEFESLETFVTRDTSRSPGSGKAMVRFIHLSPDAPAVNFYYGKERTSKLIGEEVSFKTGTPFLEVDIEEVAFFKAQIRSESEGEDAQVFQNNNVTLANGKLYTVIFQGFLDENRPLEQRGKLEYILN